MKAKGKPFEYALFATLGHNTAHARDTTPFDISVQWMKQRNLTMKKYKVEK